MKKIYTIKKIKKVYDSGIFDKMIGSGSGMDRPPLILERFFEGDVSFIKKNIIRNKINLEVGCGFGRLLFPLSNISKSVIGIDFSKSQIKRARVQIKKLNNVEIKLMHAEKMNFKDNSFDQAICFNNSLGNMPGIEKQVIREMKRVTKSGGRIIVRVFADNKKVEKSQYKNYKRLRFKDIRNFGKAVVMREGFYSRRFTKNNLKNLFGGVGLEAIIKKDGEAGYVAESIKH